MSNMEITLHPLDVVIPKLSNLYAKPEASQQVKKHSKPKHTSYEEELLKLLLPHQIDSFLTHKRYLCPYGEQQLERCLVFPLQTAYNEWKEHFKSEQSIHDFVEALDSHSIYIVGRFEEAFLLKGRT